MANDHRPRPSKHIWTTAKEYLTHWVVAGLIVALTGFAPEHWIARLLELVKMPTGIRQSFLSAVDYRLLAVCIGVAIIAAEIIIRNRRKSKEYQAVTSSNILSADFGNGKTTSSESILDKPVVLPDKPSIAVLPFENISGDPDQEYFADGITEDLLTDLAKVRWFFVISRNSSFTYKGKAVDVKQVGSELGVRYVLEGSVRKASNRVRITAQLIDATTGHHVWAERYDRELADIFAVQDEITEQVVAAIEPQLYAAEGIRAKRKSPDSLDAWECVVRALSLINSRSRPDVDTARQLLQKAIALDPGYAQAYSLLSFVTTLAVHLGWERPERTLTLASDAAHKAFLLDADDPWVHVALGFVLTYSKRAEDALKEYEKAIAGSPNFAIAHYLLALTLVYLGRSQEALAHGDIAARLSPRDLLARGNAGVINNVRASACFVGGRYRDGIEFARKAIVESPSLVSAYRILVVNCALAGEIDEARAALPTVKRLLPEISLKWLEEVLPFVRIDDRQRYLEAFRLAGLE